jgi:hypothetical protein
MQHVSQTALPSQTSGFFVSNLWDVSDEQGNRFHPNGKRLPREIESGSLNLVLNVSQFSPKYESIKTKPRFQTKKMSIVSRKCHVIKTFPMLYFDSGDQNPSRNRSDGKEEKKPMCWTVLTLLLLTLYFDPIPSPHSKEWTGRSWTAVCV